MFQLSSNYVSVFAKLPKFIVVSFGLTALTVARYVDASTSHVGPLDRFATKNAYASSSSRIKSSSVTYENGHQPAQVIGLFRHGSRYPGKGDIRAAHQVFAEFQRLNISQSILDQLQSVVDALPMVNATELAPVGATELWDLGQRLGEKYLRLFNQVVHDDIAFFTSSPARAVASGENFQSGFKNAIKNENLSWPIHHRNDLLRFFAECPKYMKEVRKNYTAVSEFNSFCSTIREGILQQIAKQIDVTKLDFSEDQLFSLYQFAAIEVAVLGTAHWASLLTSENLTALEYAADLQEYWKMGYGYPINYEISCRLLSHIFKHLDNKVNGKRHKKGVFYFGHAETVVPVLVALGLFNDGFPLTAADFNSEAARNRKFLASHISPFATNVVFVLHDVHDASSKEGFELADDSGSRTATEQAERYMLEVLVNELPIRLPFAYRHLWPYSEVRRKYEAYIENCQYKSLCGLEEESATSSVTSSLL